MLPRDWQGAVSDLKVFYALPEGKYQITHRIRNADSGAEIIDFSERLSVGIEVVHRLALERGENWNSASIVLQITPGKGITRVESSYNYGTDFGPR